MLCPRGAGQGTTSPRYRRAEFSNPGRPGMIWQFWTKLLRYLGVCVTERCQCRQTQG